jgi:hypothetical protein
LVIIPNVASVERLLGWWPYVLRHVPKLNGRQLGPLCHRSTSCRRDRGVWFAAKALGMIKRSAQYSSILIAAPSSTTGFIELGDFASEQL